MSSRSVGLAANRRASCLAKLGEGGLNLKIGCGLSGIDGSHRGIDRLQFIVGRDVVALEFALDLIRDGHELVLRLFGPAPNARQQVLKVCLCHS
jgi:hypothetical protein